MLTNLAISICTTERRDRVKPLNAQNLFRAGNGSWKKNI